MTSIKLSLLFSTIFSAVLHLCIPQESQQPQCPCYVLADGKCLAYDTRYLAADLEEAVVSFPDLSLINPPDPVDSNPELGGQKTCGSDECYACQRDIRERISQVGLKGAKEMTAEELAAASNCTRYAFSSHHDDHEEKKKDNKWSSASDEHEDDREEFQKECGKCFKWLRKHDHDDQHHEDYRNNYRDFWKPENFNAGFWPGNNGSSGNYWEKFIPNNLPFSGDSSKYKKQTRAEHRQKRQSSGQILGTRFNISCTGKGTVIGASGTVSLCSSCWAWRQLPAGYFPQFLNELICDDQDNACLSGYATCEPGLRNHEVISNVSGVMRTVTLTSGTYCECRVTQGSALYGLATGTGSTQNLLPSQSRRTV